MPGPGMKIKHQHLRGEEVNTHFGKVKLDEHGYVENMDDLEATEPQLLDANIGFMNADNLFDPREGKNAKKGDGKPGASGEPDKDKPPGDEDYKNLIKQEVAAGAPTNSEGYLDMRHLSEKCRELKWPPISGTKRIELSDQIREEIHKSDPESVITPRTSGRPATSLSGLEAGEGRATAATGDDSAPPPGTKFDKNKR